MKRYKQQKRKFYFILIMLFILSIGLGYAALTETLTISNSLAISEMKWDVGFSSVADNGGTVTSESQISADGKSITVFCDFGSNTKSKTCTAKATITNNSTFDVGLTSDPKIEYDDTYIHTLTFKWNDHPTYENRTVLKDNFIAKGTSEEVIITIKTKNLTIETLPSNYHYIPITITLNFAEWQNGELPTYENLSILADSNELYNRGFYNDRELIGTITFEDEINIPDTANGIWDISENFIGNVMSYYVMDENTGYYDLYIQSNTQLYAHYDMSNWFEGFTNLNSINGLELLDTSMTFDMECMFCETGYNSTIFSLDVSNFDTSYVENMNSMFYSAGYNSSNFTLDVSNFDTSNVDDMSGMFGEAGNGSLIFNLNVSNFDTSNVIYMEYMFYETGVTSPIFTIDVSNFDTSNVEDMSYMFESVGCSNPNFVLDVSNFDTSNVTNMEAMFAGAGYSSTNFVLDLSNFDTRNVEKMAGMFNSTGYSSINFTLDLTNFDTSNVTEMHYMFYAVGYSSTNFVLDLSNFDTSNVINMERMFFEAGYNSTKLNTSITIKNPNVENYEAMFTDAVPKTGSKITVNYTSETKYLVDEMIATKSPNSNVVKGTTIDLIYFKINKGNPDVGSEVYQVEKGMTWIEWIDSEYNVDGLIPDESGLVWYEPLITKVVGIAPDGAVYNVTLEMVIDTTHTYQYAYHV